MRTFDRTPDIVVRDSGSAKFLLAQWAVSLFAILSETTPFFSGGLFESVGQ